MTKELNGLAVREIIEHLGFDPTNHHNALKCPYCNPEGLTLAPPPQQPHGDWVTVPRLQVFLLKSLLGHLALKRARIGPLATQALTWQHKLAEWLSTPSPIDVGREEIAYAGYNVAKPADVEDGDEAVLFQAGKRAATEAILALLHPTPEQR